MDTQTYERALDRAHNEHLYIMDIAFEANGDLELARVVNPKYTLGYYTVRQNGMHLTCNCQAGQRGAYCKHRALVHEAMLARYNAKVAAEKAQIRETVTVTRTSTTTYRLSDRGWKNTYAKKVFEESDYPPEDRQLLRYAR